MISKSALPCSPLQAAFYLGSYHCAMCLINFGCDADPLSAKDLLHAAAQGGNVHLVRYLLNRKDWKLKINTHDAINRTPLHYACLFGNRQIAKLLVRRGADPTFEAPHSVEMNTQTTPLLACVLSASPRSHKVARMFLEHRSVDWHFSQDSLDKALALAALKGLVEIFDLLLQNGANPNTTVIFANSQKDIPVLHWALQERSMSMLTSLLRTPEISLLSRDSVGRTALHYACAQSDESYLLAILFFGEGKELPPSLLGQKGWFDVLGDQDSHGWTPIDYRLRYRYP